MLGYLFVVMTFVMKKVAIQRERGMEWGEKLGAEGGV